MLDQVDLGKHRTAQTWGSLLRILGARCCSGRCVPILDAVFPFPMLRSLRSEEGPLPWRVRTVQVCGVPDVCSLRLRCRRVPSPSISQRAELRLLL